VFDWASIYSSLNDLKLEWTQGRGNGRYHRVRACSNNAVDILALMYWWLLFLLPISAAENVPKSLPLVSEDHELC
jgi:hypothetical protein